MKMAEDIHIKEMVNKGQEQREKEEKQKEINPNIQMLDLTSVMSICGVITVGTFLFLPSVWMPFDIEPIRAENGVWLFGIFCLLLGKLPQAETGLEFRYLVILPTGILHESGYGTMYFVLFDDDGEPIAKVTRGTDVLMVWKKPSDWHIDCLPCGLLRFFHFGQDSKVFYNGMEFEFYPTGNKFIGEYEIKGE